MYSSLTSTDIAKIVILVVCLSGENRTRNQSLFAHERSLFHISGFMIIYVRIKNRRTELYLFGGSSSSSHRYFDKVLEQWQTVLEQQGTRGYKCPWRQFYGPIRR
ncbi:hypothetical protein AVEN_83254-1 [Araneus ventricosus]|uniref:Uncharacterized protein n=1 Tax=Araneus ventricosus TaxID=182803 RepID=A0A4Y2B9I8_ARAVE|nr:hypothetical protein AVEN_83254-1 [Araneus ventricosus]